MVVVPAGCAGKALVAGSALSAATASAPSIRADAVVAAIDTLDGIFADRFGSD
jgi:hypothetical protein